MTLSSWIDELNKMTEEFETPRIWIYWAGLTAISAVVKKNVYFDKFAYKIYPNIYILIIGKSGVGKGLPSTIVRQLVSQVDNNRVISGSNSIEAIIQDLSQVYTCETTNKQIMEATAFLHSSEFHEFLLDNPKAFTYLTDLYDTHYNPTWSKMTKGGGKEALKDICITLWGATNQDLFKVAIPSYSIGGGFLSRCIIVKADKKDKINSLMWKPKNEFNIKSLVPYLKQISEIKGEFMMADETREYFNQWYVDLQKKDFEDDKGILERLHDQVIKTSMLIALSKRLNLLIMREDLEEAIEACQMNAVSARKIVEGEGESTLKNARKVVMGAIASAPNYTISRKTLLRRYGGDFDYIDLNRIIGHFQDAGMIHVLMEEKETLYKLSDMMIERYTRFKEENK